MQSSQGKIRTDREHVGGLWICCHDCLIGCIAVKARFELQVNHTTDDLLLAGENQAVALPVAGIDMPGSHAHKIASYGSVALDEALIARNLAKIVDGSQQECCAN